MGKSPIGSVRLIHILANRSKSARRSGSFTLSARDKHSHAFARYLSTAFMAHPDGWPPPTNYKILNPDSDSFVPKTPPKSRTVPSDHRVLWDSTIQPVGSG